MKRLTAVLVLLLTVAAFSIYSGMTPYIPAKSLDVKTGRLSFTVFDGKIVNLALSENMYDGIESITFLVDNKPFDQKTVERGKNSVTLTGSFGEKAAKIEITAKDTTLEIKVRTGASKIFKAVVAPSDFHPIVIRGKGEHFLQTRNVAYGFFADGSISVFTAGKMVIATRKSRSEGKDTVFEISITVARDIDQILAMKGERVKIKRRVLDSSGNPVPGVKVVLMDGKRIVDVSTSSQDGTVFFRKEAKDPEFSTLYPDEIWVKSASGEKIVLSLSKKLYFRWKPYLSWLRKDGVAINTRLSRPAKVKVLVNGKVFSDNVVDTFHSIYITGLKPSTVYKATVVAENLKSTVIFKTLGENYFKFLVYGDTRTNPDWHELVTSKMAEEKALFVIHTGDLVESGDSLKDWDGFFDSSEKLYSQTPIFPTLGNHERNSGYYYQAFPEPMGGGDFLRRWYSYDAGDVHFVVLDSNIAPGTGLYEKQKEWLVKDLESTDKKYKIVYFHHPFFTNSPYREPSRREDLEEIFSKMGVDIVFNGHIHHYERFYKDGVMYVTTGGGGAPLGFGLKSKNRLHLPFTKAGEAGYLHYVCCQVKEDGIYCKVKAVAKYDWGKLYKLSKIIDEFEIKK